MVDESEEQKKPNVIVLDVHDSVIEWDLVPVFPGEEEKFNQWIKEQGWQVIGEFTGQPEQEAEKDG